MHALQLQKRGLNNEKQLRNRKPIAFTIVLLVENSVECDSVEDCWKYHRCCFALEACLSFIIINAWQNNAQLL